MVIFKKVAIIGVGLIGGSIGLAIKKGRLAGEVVGVGRHKKNLKAAEDMGAIDGASTNLEIIKDADLIILAVPPAIILKLASRIARVAGNEMIVCDVASTKEEISFELSRIFPKYVGAHPLAGSERQGISSAQNNLFMGSLCVLTPMPNTDINAFAKIKKLWQSFGAKITIMPAALHDTILSFTSHLPHIVAFSLMNSVPKDCLKFSAGGLRDTTRIAASDAKLWSEIFLTNRKNIIKAIEEMESNLSQIKKAVNRKDALLLRKILEQAKIKRDLL